MSQSRGRGPSTPAGTRPAGTSQSAEMNQGMRVLSYLIAGIALYGGIGWAGDHWLGTRFLLPTGLVVGAALAMYLVIKHVAAEAAGPAGAAGATEKQTTEKGRS